MSRYRNLGLFLVLAAVWGSAFVAIKAGLEYFPPVLFAAVRYDVAGLLMLGYAAYAVDDPIPRGRGQWALVGVGGLFMIAGYHAFLFVGEQGTTSAAAAVIVSLSPVLTSGFARGLLPGNRLSVIGIAGLALGLIGVAILSLGLDGVVTLVTDPAGFVAAGAVPKLLVFAAATAFALGSVLTRWLDADLEIEAMEAWSMLVGAGVMHLVSGGLGESLADVTLTAEAVAAMAYLSVAASAVGFLIYFDLLDRLGPVEINLVSYVAPLFAAATGWVLLGERLTPGTAVGFCCIFAGFLALKRRAIAAELARAERAVGAD